MIRVGSKEFQALPVKKMIALLVKRGYRQAAFQYRTNAEAFAAAWKKKGYTVEGLRSMGPVVETGKFVRRAYYVIAKSKARTTKRK